jgi:diguanylate cyclase (GGDEF)-like protein
MTIRATVGEKRYAVLQPYILRALQGETLMFEEHDESDGVERTLEVTYIPQLGEDGAAVVGFHVMRQDITSQKREKKRLLKLSQVDALTGLTNRAGFQQKLAAAMNESAEDGHLMAVMYMDIDRFKPVNDTYGHNVGDQLLKAFSARLTHTLRASDTIARLGGDEFTIIMEKITRREDASITAAKIVSAMQAPFELEGATVSVSASIGLTFYQDGALDPEALLKQADMLLYQAKQAGRNTYRAAA